MSAVSSLNSIYVRILTTALLSCLKQSIGVSDPPKLVLGSLQQDVNISCPLSGKGIFWTREPDGNSRDRKILTAGPKYLLRKCAGCDNNLQINSLNEDDEGLYACFANGRQAIKFEVKLIVPITGLALTSLNKEEDRQEGIFGVADNVLIVICSVTKSRPRPLLSVHTQFNDKKPGKTRFEQMPEHYESHLQADGSYMIQSRFKATLRKEDDLSYIVCEAVLPGLDRKLHSSKVARPLRVKYPPECLNEHDPIFIAVNRTSTVKCPVMRAYPNVIAYSWSTGQLEVVGPGDSEIISLHPRNVREIQDINCFAENGVGSATKCVVPLALGGKPDPVTDCVWSYPTNHSLQISCKLGFDQGDPYQQCVLYREDADSGLMAEYARARKCSFVIDRTDQFEKHKLQVFSLNKFGDSLQDAFTININTKLDGTALQDGKQKQLRLLIVLFLAAIFGVLLVICCWYANSDGSSQKRKRDKYLDDREHARCYRLSMENEGRNLLLPLVNENFISENGNTQDSSTVSSYLPAVDHNGHSMFHRLPETPPPVSERTHHFIDKSVDKITNFKASTESESPPPFTPRLSVSKMRQQMSPNQNCCRKPTVTDC